MAALLSTELKPRLTRRATAELELEADDKAGLRVRLTFSSEAPVKRVMPDGTLVWEVLGHGPGEVDLGYLISGAAPLLKDHDHRVDAIVGTVERAWIEGGRGVAIVHLFAAGPGESMSARVRAGEVKSVSVGYDVDQYARSGERDGLPVMRGVRWTPRELSLVAVPADPTVGVGRAQGAPEGGPTLKTREITMSTTTDEPRPAAAAQSSTAGAVHAERGRIAEIQAIAAEFRSSAPEAVERAAIADGTSVAQFRETVMEVMARRPREASRAGATMLNMRRQEQAEPEYSLLRLVNYIADPSRANGEAAAFELDVGAELQRQRGRPAEGAYVPLEVLAPRATRAQRALITTGTAPELIGIDHAADRFIDALRAEVQVIGLGATMLTGLVGNVSIPAMLSGTTAQWIAEGQAAAESAPVFDAVSLVLRQLSATSRISRRQAKQSLPAIEALLRDDMRQQVAVALDAAAIAGAGTLVEPLGILNTPGIGTVPIGDDGGPLTWAHVTALMAVVEGASVAMGSPGFLGNHKVKSQMLSVAKFTGGDEAILTATPAGTSIAGHPARFTSLVPADGSKGTGTGLSALIFGNWSDLLIAQWGGVDVIVDEMTESPQGNIRITIHSEWDIGVRHPESFAAITDIVAG